MNIDDAQKRATEIALAAGPDPEHDHVALDKLLVDILMAVTQTEDISTARSLARIGLIVEAAVETKWYS